MDNSSERPRRLAAPPGGTTGVAAPAGASRLTQVEADLGRVGQEDEADRGEVGRNLEGDPALDRVARRQLAAGDRRFGAAADRGQLPAAGVDQDEIDEVVGERPVGLVFDRQLDGEEAVVGGRLLGPLDCFRGR